MCRPSRKRRRPIELIYIVQFGGGTCDPTESSTELSVGEDVALTSTGEEGALHDGALAPNGHEFAGVDDVDDEDDDDDEAYDFFGPAGAASIILQKDIEERDEDAVEIHRFRQGLGDQTINVADYRALILGLTQALRKGYRKVAVQGNSALVVEQFQGTWRIIIDPELRRLCDEALVLSRRFESFSIAIIDEELSNNVDSEAAISLQDGEVQEEPPL